MTVQVVAELAQRTEAGRYESTGVRRPVDLLVQSLKVSAAEAHRRIRLAGAVLPVRDVFRGNVAPVRQQVLGDAFFRGEVSQEQALLVAGFVDEAARLAENGRIDQDCFVDVEVTLVEAGQVEDPDCLRRIGNRIMSHLDPDGQKPSHSDLIAKQGLFFSKPRRGLIHIDGYMTIEQHEQLMAAIGHATNPIHHGDANPSTNPSTSTSTARGAGQTTETGAEANKPGVTDQGHDTANSSTAAAAGPRAGAGPDASNVTGTDMGGQGTLFEQLHGLMGLFTAANTGEGKNGDSRTSSAQENAAGNGRGQAGQESPGAADSMAPPDLHPPQSTDEACWESRADTPTGGSQPHSAADLCPDSADGPSGGMGWVPPPGSGTDSAGPYVGESQWRSVWDGAPGHHEGERRGSVVDGVLIPSPSSGETLEGLDPIDPHSTDPVVKDDRTYGQKLLDGLLECVKLAARTETLPLNGGLKAQLIIMATKEDLSRQYGAGTAFTAYNGPVPLGLFDQSLCDPEITNLLVGEGQEILNVGRAQRLFTPAQRKILFARDLGCSFPDCTIPAPWTEAHHVIPWQAGGENNISNAALLCGPHHTLIHHSEWSLALIHGTPCFTAPYLIDPTQTPRRDTYHHGLTKSTHNTQS